MLSNIEENIIYCSNIVESLSNLLYYSHIPVAILALITSFFIVIKNSEDTLARILFFISISFAIWSYLDLVIWFSYDNAPMLMFAWSQIEIFSVLMFILAFYFLYVFIYRKDVDFKYKILIVLCFLPIILLSGTSFNLAGYNPQECIAYEKPFFAYYILSIKSILSLLMIILSINAFRNGNKLLRMKLVILLVGIFSFIFSFLLSGIIAGLTENYIIEIYGLIAMLVFIVALARLVIKFGEFNLKILGSQILVIGLISIIAAQFTFIETTINKLLNSITLIVSIFFGWLLIKSVKHEIEQREKIELLAKDLENVNNKLTELDQMKSEFLSLASHQMRAPLTAMKGYTSMLIEGEFGTLPPKAEESVKVIMHSNQNLINIVNDFLNISRIEQGKMVYEKTVFKIADLVKEVVEEHKLNIEKGKLSIKLEIPNNFDSQVNADRDKIRQVIGNIIDNSVKYTINGGIAVSLLSDSEKVMIKIKDTGIGIDPSEIGKLFSKFSRSKSANKTNVIGTGLGLYIAQKMSEDQGGKIKVFSEGEGKGSTFTIELPKAKV